MLSLSWWWGMSPYNWLNCTKVVFALYVCIKNYCSKELNDYIHWTKLNNQISGIIRTLRNCILYSSYYDLKKCTISFSTHSLTYQLRKVLLNLIKFNSWCWHIVKLLVKFSTHKLNKDLKACHLISELSELVNSRIE